ncbi:hypothetical protein Tco_0601503 [Tanacetum coccineum]
MASSRVLLMMTLVVCLLLAASTSAGATGRNRRRRSRNAYATMMYMGTPRDYEFYVAIRVMLRSLSFKLRVDADLVVIASMDVPAHWIHTQCISERSPNLDNSSKPEVSLFLGSNQQANGKPFGVMLSDRTKS